MLTHNGLRTWAYCYYRIAEQVYEHFAAQHQPLAQPQLYGTSHLFVRIALYRPICLED